ncbi:MAG: hypothetical protein U5R48_19665 [Gammaproteobacteria bacterium]|nr:hypothetical protein [Gammaproteobacteria bacterium]
MQQTADGLPRATIRTYGALGFPLALLGYPLGIWLPRAYGTGVGIDLSLVGLTDHGRRHLRRRLPIR